MTKTIYCPNCKTPLEYGVRGRYFCLNANCGYVFVDGEQERLERVQESYLVTLYRAGVLCIRAISTGKSAMDGTGDVIIRLSGKEGYDQRSEQ